jgi:hypothetical protein
MFCPGEVLFSQLRVSVASDISLQRNFAKQQEFWAFGQNILVDFHLARKDGIYLLVCYYSPEKKFNPMIATARSITTIPQQIPFTNRAQIRLKQFSAGWKHYLKGASDAEDGWSLYTVTGFGIIFGKATNSYSRNIDTSLYNIPEHPVNGEGHFKRLTIDLGLGWEIPVGGEIYFYTEGKTWIPTTEYPSKYLFVNNNAPFVVMISAGFRILF